MAKKSFTHYYVQAKEGNNEAEIVAHTYDKETKEYFHKFLDKSKAQELANKEKELTPNINFRVVKCTETYNAGDWF